MPLNYTLIDLGAACIGDSSSAYSINACGLPVIAVAEGGVRETVVDGLNGLLVEAQPEKMAQAIQKLRDDPVLARRLGENGARRVREHWSLDAATERLEDALTRTKQMAASR